MSFWAIAALAFFGLWLFVRLNKDDDAASWSSENLSNQVEVLNDHVYSEDGYWINQYQIKGYKSIEVWPCKFTVYAYVSGGSRHSIKSGFTNRKEANFWLVDFLGNLKKQE